MMSGQIPTIIYADDSLIVVDKPAGVLSIPGGYDPTIPSLKQVLELSYGRLWVVHRLDKETSGVMVFARNALAHRKLNTLFSGRQVTKTYHALILGNPEWKEKVIEKPLKINMGRRNRTVVNIDEGKYSLTRFRVLERYPNHALLEAKPQTGRRHQIRAHIYDLGFDILSDPLYGSREKSHLIPRLALHARMLSFRHPETAEIQTYEGPYPADFEQALAVLRGLAWEN